MAKGWRQRGQVEGLPDALDVDNTCQGFKLLIENELGLAACSAMVRGGEECVFVCVLDATACGAEGLTSDHTRLCIPKRCVSECVEGWGMRSSEQPLQPAAVRISWQPQPGDSNDQPLPVERMHNTTTNSPAACAFMMLLLLVSWAAAGVVTCDLLLLWHKTNLQQLQERYKATDNEVKYDV